VPVDAEVVDQIPRMLGSDAWRSRKARQPRGDEIAETGTAIMITIDDLAHRNSPRRILGDDVDGLIAYHQVEPDVLVLLERKPASSGPLR